MVINFVRHGQTLFNIAGRLQGISDSSLSEYGIKQAFRLSEWAESILCTKIFTSDLARAFETALIISKVIRVPIVPTRLLRERDLFEFEGMPYTELVALRQNTHTEGIDVTLDWDWCSHIETENSVASRVMHCVTKIKNEKGPILVTHAGVITAFIRTYANCKKQEKFHIPTGSVCQYDSEKRIFKIIKLSDNGRN